MGFIPFVRTNVPQACKTVETNNNIFGYCKNPWDPTRSTGGSSGGEGGIVAAFCSPFGLGSDIGGSLRVPAEFNVLCTLKAGQRSMTRRGNAYYGKYSGGTCVKSEYGALARSVDDLITYHSVVFDPRSYENVDPIKLDPYLTLTPFNYTPFLEKPKFRVGVTKRLDTLKASLAHERALDVSSKLLEQEGHEIVPVSLPNL